MLVERNRVSERTAAGMRRGGEETDVSRMPAVHVGMRYAAENTEVLAVFLQPLEIRRGLILCARPRREKLIRKQTEIVADAEQSPRLRIRRQRRSDLSAARKV